MPAYVNLLWWNPLIFYTCIQTENDEYVTPNITVGKTRYKMTIANTSDLQLVTECYTCELGLQLA